MKLKNIILLTILVVLLCAGIWFFGAGTYWRSASKSNMVASCHFDSKDVKCLMPGETLNCTLDLKRSNYCSKYISCNDDRKIEKEPLYDKCVECYNPNLYSITKEQQEDCDRTFPNIR